jgi:hypothetical protein
MELTFPFTSRHVGVAAEAFAAALFARCGLDISVQYGANQPEYDLVVAQGERMLKVSVKGSKDGGWGLTQNYVGNLVIRVRWTYGYPGTSQELFFV